MAAGSTHFLVSKVACAINPSDSGQNAMCLASSNPSFLKLSPDMRWVLRRMPFKDLPESHLDSRSVCARAGWTPDLKTENGILQFYY
jgi:hypothetical protein